MKIKLLFCLFALQLGFSQQRTCGTKQKMEQLYSNPEFKKAHLAQQEKFNECLQKNQARQFQKSALNTNVTIKIPVAVHFPSEVNINASAKTCLRALAQSQINILNADYNATNSDVSNWAAASSFYPGTSVGDMDVEFIIATQNHPAGTGIANGIPAVTFGTDFLNDDDEDLTWAGYMNLVVREIGGGILGYSPLGGLPNQGYTVVIDDNSFGTGAGCGANVPQAPYNLGRTLTHELGHFFNLDHTFEACDDSNCATSGDNVCDTPSTDEPYFDCDAPGTVPSTCGGSIPQLTMNYMDYVEDSCMYMFTVGQASRMLAWYNSIQSQFLTNVLSSNEFSAVKFSVYPNPSNGVVNIKFEDFNEDFSVEVYDSLGRAVNYSQNTDNKTVDLNGVSKGVYFLTLKIADNQVTKKIIIE